MPNVEPEKITFYYNVDWELTSPENSFYRREAYFNLQEMIFDGIYRDYTKDNKLLAEGYYVRGKKKGMQSEYYEDQSVKSTIEYSDTDFIVWQKVDKDKKYEVTKGTGKFTTPYYYFYDWYLKIGTMSGEFLNGKKIGTWVYHNAGKIKTDEEHYRNGKLWEHIVYTKNDSLVTKESKEVILSINSILTESLAFDKTVFSGVNQFFENQITYSSAFKRNATYPAGIKRVLLLLSQEIGVPEKNLLMIKIKINEHGQVLKPDIILSVDPTTDDRALKALKIHEARFLPAMVNGKPIATTIYLPIASGEDWLKLFDEMPVEWFLDPNNFLN